MQLLLQDFAHPLLCCTVDAGHLAEVEGAVDVHLRHMDLTFSPLLAFQWLPHQQLL